MFHRHRVTLRLLPNRFGPLGPLLLTWMVAVAVAPCSVVFAQFPSAASGPSASDAQINFDDFDSAPTTADQQTSASPQSSSTIAIAESDGAAGTDASSAIHRHASALASVGSMWGVFRDGGLLMFPIVGCSIVLLVFVLERALSLRRARIIPKPFVTRLLHQLTEQQLDADEAHQLCEEDGSVIAAVFSGAVKKWNRPSVEVEQAILDAGEREAYSLRKYLRLFNGISTITPLLGLLGTVVGMIQCFDGIANADAMGRPELLAAGIGKALLTTAAGLSVAIPALIAYLYFTSRVDRLVIEIDRLGQELVAAVASDGWKQSSRAETARQRKPPRAA